MLELFKKLKAVSFDAAIELCIADDVDQSINIDIDYTGHTIILSKKNLSLKVDYSYRDIFCGAYSKELDGEDITKVRFEDNK